MSTGEEVVFSILFAILMIGLTYFCARSLLLKSLFLRQLDALHARVAQGLPLEGAEVDVTAIPWQTVVDEASEGVRGRIDRRLFVHPVYRDAVLAYKDSEARNNIVMLLLVVTGGLLMFSLFILTTQASST